MEWLPVRGKKRGQNKSVMAEIAVKGAVGGKKGSGVLKHEERGKRFLRGPENGV